VLDLAQRQRQMMQESTHVLLAGQQRFLEIRVNTGVLRSVNQCVGPSLARLEDIIAIEGSCVNGAGLLACPKASMGFANSCCKPGNVIVHSEPTCYGRTKMEALPLRGAVNQHGQERRTLGL
jgi:hypothetical protein